MGLEKSPEYFQYTSHSGAVVRLIMNTGLHTSCEATKSSYSTSFLTMYPGKSH